MAHSKSEESFHRAYIKAENILRQRCKNSHSKINDLREIYDQRLNFASYSIRGIKSSRGRIGSSSSESNHSSILVNLNNGNRAMNQYTEELRSFRNAKREAGHSPKLSDGNKKQKQSGATRFDKKFKRAVSQVVAEMVNADKSATDTIVADISNVTAIVPATKTGSSLAGVLRRNIKENGKKTA